MKKVVSILAVVVLFVAAIIATQTDNIETLLLTCNDCWEISMETMLACNDCWEIIGSNVGIA